ncbi:uncharacterized protein LOC131182848 [Hevea brasiliensis]|uniref:uncharacterized protein LOC131182848 n=1 Tax=Hevea brasiliensis TaxID=3981 RepID=UPI0025D71F54|nr:uncharacterized protein LOC131182848 [Hevea brasiliensis]
MPESEGKADARISGEFERKWQNAGISVSTLKKEKTQRSSSSSWVPEESFKNTNANCTDKDQQQLPAYDPLSHVAKKERSRLRSAENAIHLIPLVLVLCAIILWFFSNPGRAQNYLVLRIQLFNRYFISPIILMDRTEVVIADLPRYLHVGFDS